MHELSNSRACPSKHPEADLHRGLLTKLKDFLDELGRDFCFVGSEYPLQVGDRDFALDLLFFHRGLNCLIAVDSSGSFRAGVSWQTQLLPGSPRPERPKASRAASIGVLLCATKHDEGVEFALSRSLSPSLIAEYKTHTA